MLRDHLRQQVLMWICIFLYYALPDTVGAILAKFGIKTDEFKLSGVVGAAVAGQFAANLYLDRSIYFLTQHDQFHAKATAPRFVRWFAERDSRDFILGAALIALVFAIRDFPLKDKDPAIPYVYGVQILANGVLWFRLLCAYGLLGVWRGWLVAVGVYAVAQLGFALNTPWLHAPPKSVPYLIAFYRPVVAIGVLMAARNIKHAFKGNPSTAEKIKSLGERLNTKARLRRTIQIGAGILSAVLIMLAIRYTFGVIDHADESRSLLSLLGGLLAKTTVLLVAAFLAQAVAYAIVVAGSLPVRWGRLSKGHLQECFDYAPGPGREGWENEEITAKSAKKAENRQVILVHGLFSSGPSCWGLLPLMLVNEGLADTVHLLTYKHHLWSRQKHYRVIVQELHELTKELALKYDGDTVVIGHSLGAVMVLDAVEQIVEELPRDVAARIKNVILVAPPLHGSLFAAFALPFGCAWRLVPWSQWIEDVVKRWFYLFPPPGYVAGEEQILPNISCLHNMRDSIVGTGRPFRALPGDTVPLTGWHSSAAAIFDCTTPAADAYRRQIQRSSRAVRLMQLLGASLAGKRSERMGWVFELLPDGDLAQAFVRDTQLGNWGSRLARVIDMPGGTLLHDALKTEYMKSASRRNNAQPWDDVWKKLVRLFEVSRKQRELIRLDWNPTEGETLYLFANRQAGIVLVVDESLMLERTTPAVLRLPGLFDH